VDKIIVNGEHAMFSKVVVVVVAYFKVLSRDVSQETEKSGKISAGNMAKINLVIPTRNQHL
jgi:hypothetical protein